jgi:hypothetical protein
VNPLGAYLQRRAEALATRAIDEMYRNTFWQERFGERGRRFAEQDGRSHVTYLVAALDADEPTVFTNYARWLQAVLTSRGMCTRHLDENFGRLAAALAEEREVDTAAARTILAAGRAALEYAAEPARGVQQAAPAVAAAAARALYDRRAEWQARAGAHGRARCEDDLLYHLSYVADALALGRSEIFSGYVSFMAGFLERRRVPCAQLVESLEALAEALGGAVPGSAGVDVLAAGRSALVADASPGAAAGSGARPPS